MRRELGLGEPSDRVEARGRTRGLVGWAHILLPLQSAGRAPRQAGGARRVPEMGSPGQSCRTQAPRQRKRPGGGGLGTDSEMGAQTQRWDSDRSAGIMVSYGVPIPRSQGPGAMWGSRTTRSLESTVRRPSFEFLAVKHWANHVISLKSVHWRPGPGSALKHSLSPLPATPLFVPRLCMTAISSEGNRLLSPSPGLLSSELSRMHIWSCPALKSSGTDYPTGVTSPQRGELGQRLEA